MKKVMTVSPKSLAMFARLEAGKAEFITLLWNEQTKELSLNDPGDIAIPLSTTRSVNLQMRWDDEFIEYVIWGFISQVTKERC